MATAEYDREMRIMELEEEHGLVEAPADEDYNGRGQWNYPNGYPDNGEGPNNGGGGNNPYPNGGGGGNNPGGGGGNNP